MCMSIFRSSARTSHPRIVSRRSESTFGFTDEIADRTAANNAGGEFRPVKKKLIAGSGRCLLNRIRVRRKNTYRRQPRTGLQTNPAHITKPFRFDGLRAAHRTASGDENDSATMTNGAETGIADSTRHSNSE